MKKPRKRSEKSMKAAALAAQNNANGVMTTTTAKPPQQMTNAVSITLPGIHQSIEKHKQQQQ